MAAIEVRGLTKEFKGFCALDKASFSVDEGKIVGFLGPNGAGKTTTLRIIAGLSKPTSGTALLLDQPVKFGHPEAVGSLGYLPEQPAFYGWMSGEEYLRFAAGFYQLDPKELIARVAELLDTVGLTEAKDRRIAGYSNGMKQRLGIAQALISKPQVLLLDEPFSALDPLGRREVMDVVKSLGGQKTILLSTHILSDVDKLCDEVVILNKGQVRAVASLPELKAKYSQPIVEVEFAKDPGSIATIISHFPGITKHEKTANLLKIWLSSPEILAGNRLLKGLSDHGVDIVRFGLIQPETEDLFLQLTGDKSERVS